ncbi:hypothetical protein [Microbacterium sp. AG238]|uniref:hypothetical protein n=1 Tax=Microbacterium sp. AG238 TaxID=2183994 RepID=UPI0037C835BA
MPRRAAAVSGLPWHPLCVVRLTTSDRESIGVRGPGNADDAAGVCPRFEVRRDRLPRRCARHGWHLGARHQACPVTDGWRQVQVGQVAAAVFVRIGLLVRGDGEPPELPRGARGAQRLGVP